MQLLNNVIIKIIIKIKFKKIKLLFKLTKTVLIYFFIKTNLSTKITFLYIIKNE